MSTLHPTVSISCLGATIQQRFVHATSTNDGMCTLVTDAQILHAVCQAWLRAPTLKKSSLLRSNSCFVPLTLPPLALAARMTAMRRRRSSFTISVYCTLPGTTTYLSSSILLHLRACGAGAASALRQAGQWLDWTHAEQLTPRFLALSLPASCWPTVSCLGWL